MGQILGIVSVPDRSQWLVTPGMALLFPPLGRPDQEKLSPSEDWTCGAWRRAGSRTSAGHPARSASVQICFQLLSLESKTAPSNQVILLSGALPALGRGSLILLWAIEPGWSGCMPGNKPGKAKRRLGPEAKL